MLANLSVAVPVGDKVKLTPLNVRAFGAPNVPCVPMGCSPEPLSTVKLTPTTLAEFGASRFVIGTFRMTEKLPVMCAPGVPPLQTKAISPTRSVIPSPLTGEGEDKVVQFKEPWALAKLKILLRKINGKTEYNRWDITALLGSLPNSGRFCLDPDRIKLPNEPKPPL
jgi:hypothetical protein